MLPIVKNVIDKLIANRIHPEIAQHQVVSDVANSSRVKVKFLVGVEAVDHLVKQKIVL